MYDGAGAFSAPAIWNLTLNAFQPLRFTKNRTGWPWQLNPKEVAPRFSFAWDSICCMDDQIWFAASVALKTFVQFQFRFQSLTSRSLTGTLGFNLVKCCSQISQRKRPFHPFEATKVPRSTDGKITKNHPKISAQNLPLGPCGLNPVASRFFRPCSAVSPLDQINFWGIPYH